MVISIIALLISVLLPALKAARESAPGIQCMSIMRQMGVTQQVYRNQYDGYYPPSLNFKTSTAATTWLTTLQDVSSAEIFFPHFSKPYVRATKLSSCPSGRHFPDGQKTSPVVTGAVHGKYGDYLPNAYDGTVQKHADYSGGSQPGGYSDTSGRRSMRNPSHVFDLLENASFRATVMRSTDWNTYNIPRIAFPHSDTTNVLFWDGHAAAQSRESKLIQSTGVTPSYEPPWFEKK